MPTLTIGDRKVKVDDGFLKLSPEEQNSTVEEIARSFGGGEPAGAAPAAVAPAVAPAPAVEAPAAAPAAATPAAEDPYNRVAGLAKAAGTGVAKGAIGLVGAIPWLSDLAKTGANKFIFDPVFNAISGPPKAAPERFDLNKAASPDSIQRGIESVTGEFHKPQNTAEQYAETIGSFLPGVGAGPGSLGTRLIMQAMVPGAASEAAGQYTKGSAMEGPARFGAALLAPIAMTGAGRAVSAMRAPADGMGRGASKHLVSAMEADTPQAVRAELDRLGPDAMLADAGPAFLGKTQGASLNSDEGRSVIFGTLSRRNQGTNARIQDDVNRALGPAEDPQTVTNTIRARRSEADNRAYPAALDLAPEVRTGPIMQELEGYIPQSVGLENRALTNLRDMMTRYERRAVIDPDTGRQALDARGNMVWEQIPVNQTDARILHKVKNELDNVIEHDAPGLGVPAAALQHQQYALKQFRHALNETLERQVPGYREANRQSAMLAKRADAVERGTQYLGEGKTTPSPGRFTDEFEQLELGERVAFAKGSRGEIERKLGTKSNDLQALRSELQGEGGWNTAKIATVHGDDAAEELMRSVERNLKFRDTHTKVSENSQTEIRRAAREQMKPSGFGEGDIVTPGGNATGMVLTAFKKAGLKVLNTVDGARQNRIREEVSHILTAQGAERDRHFRAIADALSRRQAGAANHSATTAAQRAIAAAMMQQLGR